MKALEFLESNDEEKIVNYLYSLSGKGEEMEYRHKKASVQYKLDDYYRSKEKYNIFKKNGKTDSALIQTLEDKLKNGEEYFYEYELEDISKSKEFEHKEMMEVWKNQLTYSEYMAERNNERTKELLEELDSLSLEEIRNKYFAKEVLTRNE